MRLPRISDTAIDRYAAAYLEWNFRAHGSAVGDDGLLVVVLPVPAVKLHAAASCQKNLKKEKEEENETSWIFFLSAFCHDDFEHHV